MNQAYPTHSLVAFVANADWSITNLHFLCQRASVGPIIESHFLLTAPFSIPFQPNPKQLQTLTAVAVTVIFDNVVVFVVVSIVGINFANDGPTSTDYFINTAGPTASLTNDMIDLVGTHFQILSQESYQLVTLFLRLRELRAQHLVVLLQFLVLAR